MPELNMYSCRLNPIIWTLNFYHYANEKSFKEEGLVIRTSTVYAPMSPGFRTQWTSIVLKISS